jgi:CheY-like chemotaxis protein
MAEILVVDDNADIRRLFRAMLGIAHSVCEAQDGASALEKIRQVHPKLMFLDWLMRSGMAPMAMSSNLLVSKNWRFGLTGT